MKSIFLIGFMGSGKTTIGKRLAKRLSYSYVDTDHIVERNQDCAISHIFAHEGEALFRNYETNALKQSIDAQIISTGGGIVERAENRQFMNESGIVIYLQATFNNISTRLQDDPTRPLWNNQDTDSKKDLFNRRLSLYEKCADHIINTDNRTIEQITEKIKKLIFVHNHTS